MVLNRIISAKYLIILTAFLTILCLSLNSLIKENSDVSVGLRSAEPEIVIKELEKSKTEGPVRLIYSYKDLGLDLCDRGAKRLDWPQKVIFKPEKVKNCPEGGIVTVVVGGRTGNLMWEYASTLALSKITGLDPFVPNCLKDELSKMFENLTVPSFQQIYNCPIKVSNYVEALDDWNNHTESIIIPKYHFQKAPVSLYLNLIKKEFTFKPKIRQKAAQVINQIVAHLPPSTYTFVAVHVRRTDYIKYLKRKYGYTTTVNPKFFKRAMDYFKQKYEKCVFVFISDDPKWCQQTFGRLRDVFVPAANAKTKNTPALDLAVMAACNHTIYDYGTFGDWGAFLAGGEVVMYNMTDNVWKPNFLDNWSLMD